MEKGLILFDDECLICNSFIEFIDKRNNFFLYSTFDNIALFNELYDLEIINQNKIIVIINGDIYYGIMALKAIFKILYKNSVYIIFFKIVPIKILEFFYWAVAKYRYVFGKKTKCNFSLSIQSKIINQSNVKKFGSLHLN